MTVAIPRTGSNSDPLKPPHGGFEAREKAPRSGEMCFVARRVRVGRMKAAPSLGACELAADWPIHASWRGSSLTRSRQAKHVCGVRQNGGVTKEREKTPQLCLSPKDVEDRWTQAAAGFDRRLRPVLHAIEAAPTADTTTGHCCHGSAASSKNPRRLIGGVLRAVIDGLEAC